MKRAKVTKAVVSVAAGVTVAALAGQMMPANAQPAAAGVKAAEMVGQIMPVNLQANPTGFCDDSTFQQCCGPQAQSCPQFKCAAPY